jgi:hypothetical protein
MDENRQKEQFSLAYVCSIIAVAGYTSGWWPVDEDSVDMSIAASGAMGLPRRPQVDVQLKCTSTDVLAETEVRFPLKRKNYDELRNPHVIIPRILVVIIVPKRIEEWLRHTEDELALRRCGYWVSLRGYPDTTNTQPVTVSLPRAQTFTPQALVDMMTRINDGGLP